MNERQSFRSIQVCADNPDCTDQSIVGLTTIAGMQAIYCVGSTSSKYCNNCATLSLSTTLVTLQKVPLQRDAGNGGVEGGLR